MATTATASRPMPPATRRNATTSPSPTPASSSTARGTTRSAASRPPTTNAAVSRRPSTKPSPPVQSSSAETKESLTASLKMETDQKEQLLVQLQNKEQAVSTLTAENDNLQSALNAAETRVNELYADQARSEAELANRIDIADKLRGQVRELEKEKRDVQRRYNEQITTFEAERQAFYDNEQHLKSRIQSLMQAKKQPEPAAPSESESDAEFEEDADLQSILDKPPPKQEQDLDDPESEPAEMTALKLELSTLSTSYSSLQSTLVLLQTQLMDLKRVNNELQEENESYMILLREKTLSGQFDVMRHVGPSSSDDGSEEDEEVDTTDGGSLRSSGRNTLDRVPEEPSEDTLESELEKSLQQDLSDSASLGSRHANRQTRKRTTSSAGRGESLADLPITGPGLDLAAELGRAENKDILEGNIIEEQNPPKGKRARKNTESRKVITSDSGNLDTSGSLTDIDALQKEVKSLKDANKALSLYASKIIDRIIAQEGFEHVLAIDYDKNPRSPTTPLASNPPPTTFAKLRPQSVIVNRSTSNGAAKLPHPTMKTQRRSLSFDWKGFSLFNSTEKKPEPNLRPLTLGTAPVVSGGRKLDNQEDDEDRRERERLAATMKLMGIQPPEHSPMSQTANPIQKSASTSSATTPLVSMARRFSIFGGRPNSDSQPSSGHSTPSLEGGRVGLGVSTDLTHEALEHAEAENSLAALDAHERTLSADIARGGPSGFTEIQPRSMGRRTRRSVGGSGSGSTVWSAGLSDGNNE